MPTNRQASFPAIWQAVEGIFGPKPFGVAKGMTLGAVLREARHGAGLSTRDLERATGISNAQISKVEGGARSDPSFRTVARLARGIGISLDEVLARTEGRSSTPGPTLPGRARALAALRKVKAEYERLGKTIDSVTKAVSKAGD